MVSKGVGVTAVNSRIHRRPSWSGRAGATAGRLSRLARTGACLAAVTVLASACAVFGSQTPNPATQHAPKSEKRKSENRKSDCPISGCSTDAAKDQGHGADPPGVGVGRSYGVGSKWITFNEPAYTVDGSVIASRRLLTQIRYPLAASNTSRPAKGPFPMIVFAPGFMQCGAPYSKLLRFWATAGYVVVVVNFPNSDCLVADPTENDMLNQPRDMSYVITRMLRLSRAKHGLFAGLLNPKQISIAGQSDGGDTVAAVAANTCCTDRRVKAVAVESGSEWPQMRGRYFTKRFTKHPTPILFSQGSADTINPAGCSVTLYHADRAKANFYLELFGASHTGPYWGTNGYERIVARVTLAFFDRYVLKRRHASSVMRKRGNASGVAALFSDRRGNLPPAIPGPPCF
jgi:dienelactone hydrolase